MVCCKDYLSPLNYFGTFVKNQLTINVQSNSGWYYFNNYILIQNHNYCSLNQVVQEFQLHFVLKNILITLGPLHFHKNFRLLNLSCSQIVAMVKQQTRWKYLPFMLALEVTVSLLCYSFGYNQVISPPRFKRKRLKSTSQQEEDQGQAVGKRWNRRYYRIHLWKKLSATFYPLATIIHIIPHEKYTAPSRPPEFYPSTASAYSPRSYPLNSDLCVNVAFSWSFLSSLLQYSFSYLKTFMN